MTETQAVIWKQIVHAYDRWDPDWVRLMPVRDLADLLPGVAASMLGETLAQAAAERVAEVGHIGEQPSFRPLQAKVAG